MRFLLTGMNGTVAPAVAHELIQQGHDVSVWDRATMPFSTRNEVANALEIHQAEAVMHFAMGSTDWTEWMALECLDRGIQFFHTSSVSVLGANQVGPFSVNDLPEPDDDYGRYKFEGEQRALAANPKALVVRIGWQIGDAPGSNNMVDFFAREIESHGVIRASVNWIPGCSLLHETAKSLVRHFLGGDAGLRHLDSNPGFNMFEIGQMTLKRLGLDWPIETIDGMHRNHRMIDDRMIIPQLSRVGE